MCGILGEALVNERDEALRPLAGILQSRRRIAWDQKQGPHWMHTAQSCIKTHTHVIIHMHIYMRTPTQAHTNVHTHTYTHTHIHTHVCMHACSRTHTEENKSSIKKF